MMASAEAEDEKLFRDTLAGSGPVPTKTASDESLSSAGTKSGSSSKGSPHKASSQVIAALNPLNVLPAAAGIVRRGMMTQGEDLASADDKPSRNTLARQGPSPTKSKTASPTQTANDESAESLSPASARSGTRSSSLKGSGSPREASPKGGGVIAALNPLNVIPAAAGIVRRGTDDTVSLVTTGKTRGQITTEMNSEKAAAQAVVEANSALKIQTAYRRLRAVAELHTKKRVVLQLAAAKKAAEDAEAKKTGFLCFGRDSGGEDSLFCGFLCTDRGKEPRGNAKPPVIDEGKEEDVKKVKGVMFPGNPRPPSFSRREQKDWEQQQAPPVAMAVPVN